MILTKIDLNPYLFGLLGNEELVNRWWSTPNKAFKDECPENADIELVRDYIMWHSFASGG